MCITKFTLVPWVRIDAQSGIRSVSLIVISKLSLKLPSRKLSFPRKQRGRACVGLFGLRALDQTTALGGQELPSGP